MSRPYMRTNAEAHMYMDQRPCACGDIEFERQSAVMNDGGVLCSRYFGKCRSCSNEREFIFELPPTQRPVSTRIEFGGADRSRLLDAGEWMAVSEYYAKLDPGTQEDLETARAALDEVMKFLPDGADDFPDDAFWTERGRAVRGREPGRFRRARLAAVLDAFCARLAELDLTVVPVAWTHSGDAEYPYTAEVHGQRYTIRINDFPAEPLYTLMAEGRELRDLEDWPNAWAMPAPPQSLLDRLKPRDRPALAPHRSDSGLGSQLPRLMQILEQRGGPVLPLLRAVEAAQERHFYLEVSALSRKLTILLPARPEVLAPLAPELSLGELPPRPLLKVFVDGGQLSLALVSVGGVPPSQAVDVAPEHARAEWLELVSEMHQFGNARVSSRLRFLGRPRASIDVLYDGWEEDDASFATSLDRIAGRLAIQGLGREVAKLLHSSLQGAGVVVTTACAEAGPSPELAFMYGNTDWDEAVRLCTLVASEDTARGGAAVLGMLSATLAAPTTSGVQLVLRPDGPDVVVLVTLK